MKDLPLLTVLLALSIWSCKESNAPVVDPPSVDVDHIADHIERLASDEFMGRMPFGPGDKLTVDYLVSQCKEMGLQPANGDLFTQDVPMIETTTEITAPLTITGGKGKKQYRTGTDYVIGCPKDVKSVEIVDAELVFCGYGIVDEKIGWNDFEGVDLTDKIAVVLVNDPGFGSEDSTFFKGNTMTYYGRWTYKYEEADRQGAKGLLIIHETSMAGYPWFVVESSWSGPQLGIESETVQNGADFKGWISLSMARELFENAGLDFTESLTAARTEGFKPFSLEAKASVAVKNEVKRDVSQNVVAYIPGKKSPKEAVLYSAHWDHLGIGKPVAGDSIYNGALDNASGVAIALDIAKQLSSLETAPDRSIVFAFVTAEEQGLLGSQYYAEHPLFEPRKTVCNLNVDGCNPAGPMKDFQIVGIGHSEMDKYAEEELAKQDRYVLPDQQPEKGFFFRSDHFNFAKIGIPALFGEGGFDQIPNGVEYGKKFKDDYTEKNYHQPSDEFDRTSWRMEGIEQDAQLYLNIGHRLANSEEWPQWNSTSEFKR